MIKRFLVRDLNSNYSLWKVIFSGLEIPRDRLFPSLVHAYFLQYIVGIKGLNVR